ncbi:MAG: hypothetical protein HFG88_15285 [Dorea sp.]|nr:hypothetical protein [Dorea sp.]
MKEGMWCIISDNLSAKNILDLCEKPDSKEYIHNYYFQKYLYALVLWDAIYKAPRKSQSVTVYTDAEKKRQEKKQENELIRCVKSTIFDLPFDYEYDEIETVSGDVYYEWLYNIGYEKNRKIKEDTIFYLTLSQIADMNILLSEQRADFVLKSGIAKKIWTREDVLEYIDKEIYEICKEIYSFMDKEIINIQTPLLVDYICQYATSFQDAINIAFQLKEHKDIIEFRQTMNLLDNAVNNGNTMQFKEYVDRLAEIVVQISRKEVPTKKIEMKFTVTPSLTNPTISAMFGIPIEYNKKRKINMNFLLELAQYGLTHERNYVI